MKLKFKGLMYSWTVTDDHILYGGLVKSKIRLNEIGDISFNCATPPSKDGEISLGHIRIYRLERKDNLGKWDSSSQKLILDDKGILLSYRYEQQEEAGEAAYHMIAHSRMNNKDKKRVSQEVEDELSGIALKRRKEFFAEYGSDWESDMNAIYGGSGEKKKASVVGRAVVGGIIAGPTGAVIGAISAADKNNMNKK